MAARSQPHFGEGVKRDSGDFDAPVREFDAVSRRGGDAAQCGKDQAGDRCVIADDGIGHVDVDVGQVVDGKCAGQITLPSGIGRTAMTSRSVSS